MNDNQTIQSTITEIESLCQRKGYACSLALILAKNLFARADQLADINWFEGLSHDELGFLIGLFAKHPIEIDYPSKEELQAQIEGTYKLFQQLHIAYMTPGLETMVEVMEERLELDERESYGRVFGGYTSLAEPLFYSGSEAYYFQFGELAVQRYSEDKNWLKEKKKVHIAKLLDIAASLLSLQESKFRAMLGQLADYINDTETVCDKFLDIFCFSRQDLSQYSEEEIDSFLNVFSAPPASLNASFESPLAFNALESRPIIALHDDNYFLPISIGLFQSIYESPFYWMLEDDAYRETSFQHRGEATEEIAYKILRGVFGSQTYKRVKLYNKKGELLTDIDVLAIQGNKALIMQAKSKKMTETAKTGNQNKIEEDFKKAVQDSYEQAKVCRDGLLDPENYLLSEEGEAITLAYPITEAYLACVTSDVYPALTHQASLYLDKQEHDPYPLVLHLFTLQILAFYLDDPFKFLYYVKQRTETSDYFKAFSETSYLAFHLKHNLFKKEDEHGVLLVDESYSQLIDANYPALRGFAPHTKAIEKLNRSWTNRDYDQIVDEIKLIDGPNAIDAVFFLYDFTGEGADQVTRAIEATKNKCKVDRGPHSATLMVEDRMGLSYICHPSYDEMNKELLRYTTAKKYQTKARYWLGLGSVSGSDSAIEAFIYDDSLWEEDQEKQALVNSTIITTTKVRDPSNLKKVGRNDPCPCRSGKKYKKCCGA
jgi:hypothetical protein